MSNRLDYVFKILLVGDAAVGKSSVLVRYAEGSFKDDIQSTVGLDFKVKVVDAICPDGLPKQVKLTIWDTAGQERFQTITSSYYRGALGIILVYDVLRQETFDSLSMWLEEVKQFSKKEVVKLLVGNKIDLPRVVARETAEEFARNKGMLFLETSAKSDVGIEQVFAEVVQKILENPALLPPTTSTKSTNNNSTSGPSTKTGCC